MQEIVAQYFEAVKNMYVGEIIRTPYAVFAFGDIIDDTLWNVAITTSEKNIEQIEKVFAERNLTPTLYCNKELNLSGYKKSYTDAMMKKELKENVYSKTFDIAISEEKQPIIDLIMEGFSTHDSNDPYSDISPLYRNALEKNFGKSQTGWQSLHYVCKINGKSISIATATYQYEIAFVNNVTTLKDYRGKGIAKEIMSFLENNLLNRGVKQVVLTTEKDAYTEKFYEKLGYKTFEIWNGYTKEKNE